VTAFGVVETLDVVKDVCLGFFASFADPSAVDPFNLQGRVVLNLSSAAHADGDALLHEQSLELITRVLAALIRVVKQ
jgi:hypothetical protein